VSADALVSLLSPLYQVERVDRGQDAINRASQADTRPDLVLLSIDLPDLSGYSVLKYLKNQDKTSRMSVILITSSDSDAEEEGLKLGALDYIVRPFNESLVKARVRNYIDFAKYRRMLEELVNIDSLTGIANRRCLDRTLMREWRRCMRAQASFGLVMIDIDDFKSYNDHYGHAAGDEAMAKVAQLLEKQLNRSGDLLAHYGGGEFCLLVPQTELEGLEKITQLLCSAVRSANIEHAESKVAPYLTISIGAVVIVPEADMVIEKFIQAADHLLYEVKLAGKNDYRCVALSKDQVKLGSLASN